MAEERSLAIRRVADEMDSTRRAIQRSVEEIRGRVRETTDWRRQLIRRPITSLLTAAALGLIVARMVTPARRRAATSSPVLSGMSPKAELFGYAVKSLGLITELRVLPWLVSNLPRVCGRRPRSGPAPPPERAR